MAVPRIHLGSCVPIQDPGFKLDPPAAELLHGGLAAGARAACAGGRKIPATCLCLSAVGGVGAAAGACPARVGVGSFPVVRPPSVTGVGACRARSGVSAGSSVRPSPVGGDGAREGPSAALGPVSGVSCVASLQQNHPQK